MVAIEGHWEPEDEARRGRRARAEPWEEISFVVPLLSLRSWLRGAPPVAERRGYEREVQTDVVARGSC